MHSSTYDKHFQNSPIPRCVFYFFSQKIWCLDKCLIYIVITFLLFSVSSLFLFALEWNFHVVFFYNMSNGLQDIPIIHTTVLFATISFQRQVSSRRKNYGSYLKVIYFEFLVDFSFYFIFLNYYYEIPYINLIVAFESEVLRSKSFTSFNNTLSHTHNLFAYNLLDYNVISYTDAVFKFLYGVSIYIFFYYKT